MNSQRSLTFVALALIPCSGCQESANREPDSSKPFEAGKAFSQINVKEQSNRPDIDISDYTLITNNAEADRADAEAIMEVKKNYPVAMRTKDRALFDRILARNFTFRGRADFFGRADYIDNRVQGAITDWSVKYENIALQLFGEIAIVTYRNVIKGNDALGKPDYTEHMSWADIYLKENGEWKIGAVHLIDYREEIH